MKLTIIFVSVFLIFQFSLTKADEDDENSVDFQQVYPKNLEDNSVYKKFMKTVEENKMNVTVVLTTINKYKNGKNKEIYSAALRFPVNNIQLKQTNFIKNDKNFLKLAENNNLIANTRTTKIKNGNLQYKGETVKTNMENVTISAAHKILTYVRKNQKGFQFEHEHGEDNVLGQHVFLTPDGTTKVHFGKLRPVVESSQDISDEDIEFIKKILFRIHFIYDDYDVKARMIVSHLEEKLPKYNWQVVTDIDENSFIDSSTFLTLKLLNDKYTIFAI